MEEHLQHQIARDRSVKLELLARVRRWVFRHRIRSVVRLGENLQQLLDRITRTKRHQVIAHDFVHAEFIPGRTREFGLFQERCASYLDVRVVDAVRVLVADRLGGENREHERNNQLHPNPSSP